MRELNLFCLPYAGGSTAIYFHWKKILDSKISLVPIELSGRGSRIQSSLYDNMESTIEDLYEIIKSRIDDKPYAIFGHSLGSLIGYELTKKLINTGHKSPIHMFNSGKRAPFIIKNYFIHSLSDKNFINEIIKLNGSPKDIFKNKELLDLFLPILRADFKMFEDYRFSKQNKKLSCDLTVLGGDKDNITFNDLTLWKKCSNGKFNIHILKGNHFFIHNNTEEIVDIINSTLSKY